MRARCILYPFAADTSLEDITSQVSVPSPPSAHDAFVGKLGLRTMAVRVAGINHAPVARYTMREACVSRICTCARLLLPHAPASVRLVHVTVCLSPVAVCWSHHGDPYVRNPDEVRWCYDDRPGNYRGVYVSPSAPPLLRCFHFAPRVRACQRAATIDPSTVRAQ